MLLQGCHQGCSHSGSQNQQRRLEESGRVAFGTRSRRRAANMYTSTAEMSCRKQLAETSAILVCEDSVARSLATRAHPWEKFGLPESILPEFLVNLVSCRIDSLWHFCTSIKTTVGFMFALRGIPGVHPPFLGAGDPPERRRFRLLIIIAIIIDSY